MLLWVSWVRVEGMVSVTRPCTLYISCLVSPPMGDGAADAERSTAGAKLFVSLHAVVVHIPSVTIHFHVCTCAPKVFKVIDRYHWGTFFLIMKHVSGEDWL